jgi:hypothetical protein
MAGPNKVAPDFDPMRRSPLSWASDLRAWVDVRSRRRGGGGFAAVLVLQLRRRGGVCSSAAMELRRCCTGAGPACGVCYGVDGGGLQMLVVPVLGLKALTGSAGVFRRQRRPDVAVLRFGRLGVHPRPMCHNDMGLAVCGGEFKRSTKQLGCEEALPDLGFVVFVVFSVGVSGDGRCRRRLWVVCSGVSRELDVIFCFLGVLCAICPDSWSFWAVLGAACDVLSSFAI